MDYKAAIVNLAPRDFETITLAQRRAAERDGRQPSRGAVIAVAFALLRGKLRRRGGGDGLPEAARAAVPQ